LKPGEVCLLENLRFHKEEEKNEKEFAAQLGALGDIYVDDAFGTSHRAHASTEGVTHFVRPALAGFLMEKEITMLSQTLDHPARPFATIIGGAKVSSKIGVLENLLTRVEVMVIGGAMAFSFLKAQGKQVGKSLVEDDRVDYCRELLKKADEKGVKIILPVDVVCACEIKAGAARETVDADKIPADQMGLDVGPKTSCLIDAELKKCQTILWNGPLGVFEVEGFDVATFRLVDTLVDLTRSGVKTIVGGGDSVAALGAKNIADSQLTHVSTGGGASLEFIEGLELPGVACLDEAEQPAASRK
jgi:phosphoglycerate kinase